jgi:DNA gyrase subunit A
MVVKDGYDLMLISHDGTVIRTAAEGISRMGRATQGVRVMNLREADRVSAIARVTEPQGAGAENGDGEGEPGDGTAVPPEAAVDAPEPPDAQEEDGVDGDGDAPA